MYIATLEDNEIICAEFSKEILPLVEINSMIFYSSCNYFEYLSMLTSKSQSILANF